MELELWMVIGTYIGAGAAIGAMIVAIVQASRAKGAEKRAVIAQDAAKESAAESARLAARATEAFVDSAAQTKRLADLKARELAPQPWTGPRNTRGEILSITNTSGRLIAVTSITVDPVEATRRVPIVSPDRDVYEQGQSIEYLVSRGLGGPNAERIIVVWSYADEPGQLNTLHVSL